MIMKKGAVAFVVVLVVVVSAIAAFELGARQQEVGTSGTTETTRVLETGTVQQVVGDCAPGGQVTTTASCKPFDVIVLRAVNGDTYNLLNLTSSAGWVGQNVTITGLLVVPGATRLGFVQGDLTVSTIVNAT